MKKLWKVQVLSEGSESRSGWIAADSQLQATKMAMKEDAVLIDSPEDWDAGDQNQVFWRIESRLN